MEWTQPVAAICTAGIVLLGIGALVALATNGLLDGPNATAAAIGLVLVAGSVLLMVLVGRRSGRWTANPASYW